MAKRNPPKPAARDRRGRSAIDPTRMPPQRQPGDLQRPEGPAGNPGNNPGNLGNPGAEQRKPRERAPGKPGSKPHEDPLGKPVQRDPGRMPEVNDEDEEPGRAPGGRPLDGRD